VELRLSFEQLKVKNKVAKEIVDVNRLDNTG